MDVSVIIVNYNTRDLTVQAVQSVYTYTRDLEFEIIVVDNASSDLSVVTLRQTFPSIQIIENETNIGFGRANNLGIKASQGEFCFLLNSDAFLTSNALFTFLDYMRTPGHENVAICGGELSTGKHNISTVSYGNFPSLIDSFSAIGFFTLYRSYYYQNISAGVVNKKPEIRPVDYINGANMFIRKTILEKIGAFDEDFFLYFEETELSYRFKKSGYISVIIPHVKIIHLTGSSQVSSTFNYNRHYNFSRGRNLYFLKCHGRIYTLLVQMCNVMWEISMAISGKRKGNIFKKIKLVFS